MLKLSGMGDGAGDFGWGIQKRLGDGNIHPSPEPDFGLQICRLLNSGRFS